MTTAEACLPVKNNHSVDRLLQLNEQHYEKFKKKPFFTLIESGMLNTDEKKRDTFFSLVQLFSDYFQTMIQIRQANCRDPKFYDTFLTHFMEELGHDELLRQRKNKSQTWDPVIAAVCTWFVYQMQVLDNIEKAVVMHLVLEKTGDYYHTVGNHTLSQHMQSEYYAVHAEHDEDHSAMIMDLLPGYPEFTYRRLAQLIDESWQMMCTMVDRVYELVMKAA